MKELLLFVISFFVVTTLSYATPAPARKSSPARDKTVVAKATDRGQKNVKPSKKVVTTRKYKVRAGDNLYDIARRQGMKLADLQRLNGLKTSRLKPGQILLLSGAVKKTDKVQGDEVAEEPGKVISQISLPNAEGEYNDSLSAAGIEPIARTYLSIPYRYGAQSRKSTDCSGFVQQVFREFDIKLPRTAREQYTVGMKIDRSSLASGDLLFFRTRARKKYPTHVGIYLGNGKMIHASSRQHKVVISDVNHPFYVKRYVGAKRTATFLPGEIDLEMLARQVTGFENENDTPLSAAIAADVQDENDIVPVQAVSLQSVTVPGVVLEAGYDDRNDAAAADEAGDDIDNDVEPDPEAIIQDSPRLGGILTPPSADHAIVDGIPAIVVSADSRTVGTDYEATAASTPYQSQR